MGICFKAKDYIFLYKSLFEIIRGFKPEFGRGKINSFVCP